MSLSEPHTIVVYGTTCINLPTMSVPSHDTDTLHTPTLPRGESLAPSPGPTQKWITGDSYRTESENADDGKAKSRDSRATNCGAGTRDQWTTSYLRSVLVGVPVHPWVSHTFVLPVTSHTPFFTLPYISTTRTRILDKTYTVTHMYKCIRTCIEPTFSHSMPPTTQLRLAPSDDYHLSS